MSRKVEEWIGPGSKFGRLTIIEETRSPPRRGRFYRYVCDCGNNGLAYGGHLRAGMKSCGCIKGANRTHQMSHKPEYRAWDNARSRCYREKDRKFPDYGGRGIKMCDEWRNSFDAFYRDMGNRPSPNHSLDRQDNDGNYDPGNCRWATPSEQNQNRRPFRKGAGNGS